MSAAIPGVVAAIAPAIAWFYGEPRLVWITVALPGGFILGGLTVQHQALLRRQMRFGALAGIDIAALASGIAAAIVSAWYGAGCWALVIMHLAMALVTALGVWIMCWWIPGRPVRGAGVRPMLAFGGHLKGFNVLNYFNRSLDKVLIGWRWGAPQLGLYAKAYQLLLLPIRQINAPLSSVAIPALSRLQVEPDRYRAYYLRAIKLIALVTMPLIVAMGVLSKELICLVLGGQWSDASGLFTILACAAFLQPVVNSLGWVLVSLSHT